MKIQDRPHGWARLKSASVLNKVLLGCRLTGRGLAEKSGVNRETISALRRGQREWVYGQHAHAIEDELDVRAADLFELPSTCSPAPTARPAPS